MSYLVKNISGRVLTMPKKVEVMHHEVDNWAIGMVDEVDDAVINNYRNHADAFTIVSGPSSFAGGTVLASGVVSYDAAGKTYDSSATVVAAGNAIGNATVLTAEYNVVTGADGAKGVKLPVAAADEEVTILNADATNALKVYPVALSQINALGASAAFTLPAGQTATFIGRSATQWYVGASTGSLAGLTASVAELNYNDITTPGTAQPSKTVTTDANNDTTGQRNLTLTGAFDAQTLKTDAVTLSPLKWVDVAVTAALLDAAGTVNVIAGVAGDQYKIREIILMGGGTNYGAGGDRLIDLTDGTTVWTQIANADIEAAPAASLRWGDVKVPLLTGTGNTASVAGQAIRFVYSGGTTDHGGVGSINFSVCLEKVA